jgi:hypothetical protein
MSLFETFTVLCEGVWLYAGTMPVRIRLVQSNETWGTGDFADEEASAENQPIPSVFAIYEAAGKPGEFCNVLPNLGTVEMAKEIVEAKFPGVRWIQSTIPLDPDAQARRST